MTSGSEPYPLQNVNLCQASLSTHGRCFKANENSSHLNALILQSIRQSQPFPFGSKRPVLGELRIQAPFNVQMSEPIAQIPDDRLVVLSLYENIRFYAHMPRLILVIVHLQSERWPSQRHY